MTTIFSQSRNLLSKVAARPNQFGTVRWSSSSSVQDYHIRSLPAQFLRASDSSNYDPTTHQRIDFPYDSATGKPGKESKNRCVYCMKHVSLDGDDFNVRWSDGVSTRHSTAWVQRALCRWQEKIPEDRVLWTNLTEQHVRNTPQLSIPFAQLVTEKGMKRAINSLYRYGILLVTGTPIDDGGAGVAALGAAVGGATVKAPSTSILANYLAGGLETVLPNATDGPLRTLYGSVWSTSTAGQPDGTSIADSAYSNDGLPLHTDMTYMRDPPGLQIFTMVQPAIEGGESVFSDGFAVAAELKLADPDAFDVLCKTIRRYRSIDTETGWHLEASGPVIQIRDRQIVGIRHNDLDRLPDLPPAGVTSREEVDAFYESINSAHEAWDELLGQEKFRLVMRLNRGDTMLVANQRCFHGRCGFSSSSPRSVMGCYVSQDDLSSRFRMEGFDV